MTPCVMQIFFYPTDTVYDAKRLVGRKFSDAQVQADIRNMKWPFRIEGDANDWPNFVGELAELPVSLYTKAFQVLTATLAALCTS